MSQQPPIGSTLSYPQKWQLIAENLEAWYLSWPSAAHHTTNGTDLSIPDTFLTPERAVVSSPDLSDEKIDQILDYYRSRKNPAKEVLIWHLHDSSPEHRRITNAKFLARGAGIYGSSERMWCDLPHSGFEPDAGSGTVEGVMIETRPVDVSKSLPAKVSQYTLTARPTQDSEQVFGSVILNLTRRSADGEEATCAGLFSMFVNHEDRKRGIGTMLAKAACDLAWRLGCVGVHLHATNMGRRVYEKVGFEMMGCESVWRLDRVLCRRFYEEERPRGDVMKLLEAVCLGDLEALGRLGDVMQTEELQEPTRNGMTAMELAVHCGQDESAEWLIRKGVKGDVLSSWDLGWKQKARELVAELQEMVHVREGRSGRTLMDVALQRDDQELAALLASVPLPRVAENTGNDIDIGAVDWRKCFDGADFADLEGIPSRDL